MEDMRRYAHAMRHLDALGVLLGRVVLVGLLRRLLLVRLHLIARPDSVGAAHCPPRAEGLQLVLDVGCALRCEYARICEQMPWWREPLHVHRRRIGFSRHLSTHFSDP